MEQPLLASVCHQNVHCVCVQRSWILQAPNPADSLNVLPFHWLQPLTLLPPTPHPIYKINQVSTMLSYAVSSASILVKLFQQGQPAAFSEHLVRAEECV